MKIKKISILVMLIFLGISLLYVTVVYGHRNSAPNLECISCHEGEVIQDMVKIEGVPKSYIPGRTYKLKVIINSDLESISESKGGFAVEVTAGKLKVIDKKNTQLSNGFITHTQEGSELRKWSFEWTAPKEKIDVGFSVMAVAANGDYSPSGDKVGAAVYSIKPAK
jgi:hypothetical protein